MYFVGKNIMFFVGGEKNSLVRKKNHTPPPPVVLNGRPLMQHSLKILRGRVGASETLPFFKANIKRPVIDGDWLIKH